MIATEAFDKLQAFLRATDLEAEQLLSGHERLEHIIRSHQAGPAPRGAYGLLTLQASTDLGEVDGVGYREATVSAETRVIQKRCRSIGLQFAFDIFASDATDRINRFRLALISDAAVIPLYPFAVRDIRRIRATGELVGEHWQGRAALIIELAGIESAEFAIDVIESGTVDFEPITSIGNAPPAPFTFDKT